MSFEINIKAKKAKKKTPMKKKEQQRQNCKKIENFKPQFNLEKNQIQKIHPHTKYVWEFNQRNFEADKKLWLHKFNQMKLGKVLELN